MKLGLRMLALSGLLALYSYEAQAGPSAPSNIASGTTAASSRLQHQWMVGVGSQDVLKATKSPSEPTPIWLNNDPLYKPDDFIIDVNGIGIGSQAFGPLNYAYNTTTQDISRVLIDGFPLSEDRPLELMAGKAWNFLQWLQRGTMMDIWNGNFGNIPAGAGEATSSAARMDRTRPRLKLAGRLS